MPTYTNTPTITITPTITYTLTPTPNSRVYYYDHGFSFVPPQAGLQKIMIFRMWNKLLYKPNSNLLCRCDINLKNDVITSPEQEAEIKILSYSKLAFLEFQYEKPFPTEYFS